MPSLAVANDHTTCNYTVNGVRVRSKIVPAVTEVRCEHVIGPTGHSAEIDQEPDNATGVMLNRSGVIALRKRDRRARLCFYDAYRRAHLPDALKEERPQQFARLRARRVDYPYGRVLGAAVLFSERTEHLQAEQPELDLNGAATAGTKDREPSGEMPQTSASARVRTSLLSG